MSGKTALFGALLLCVGSSVGAAQQPTQAVNPGDTLRQIAPPQLIELEITRARPWEVRFHVAVSQDVSMLEDPSHEGRWHLLGGPERRLLIPTASGTPRSRLYAVLSCGEEPVLPSGIITALGLERVASDGFLQSSVPFEDWVEGHPHLRPGGRGYLISHADVTAIEEIGEGAHLIHASFNIEEVKVHGACFLAIQLAADNGNYRSNELVGRVSF